MTSRNCKAFQGRVSPFPGTHLARDYSTPVEMEAFMKPGDALRTTMPIRSQKTGLVLPRDGKFVEAIENLGRTLILVNFGIAGDEYLFPNEVQPERSQ